MSSFAARSKVFGGPLAAALKAQKGVLLPPAIIHTRLPDLSPVHRRRNRNVHERVGQQRHSEKHVARRHHVRPRMPQPPVSDPRQQPRGLVGPEEPVRLRPRPAVGQRKPPGEDRGARGQRQGEGNHERRLVPHFRPPASQVKRE